MVMVGVHDHARFGSGIAGTATPWGRWFVRQMWSATYSRVAADAVDEVGVAEVLEPLAQHVRAGHRGDAAVLRDLAAIVEDRQPQPLVRTAMAGGPHDRRDPGGARGRVMRPPAPVRPRRPARLRAPRTTSPCRFTASSMRASIRDSFTSATLVTRRRLVSNETRVPSVPVNRPTSWTPLACNVARSSDEWSGRPTSCSDGSFRAATTSRTSSMDRSKAPIMSSHQKMSMPR